MTRAGNPSLAVYRALGVLALGLLCSGACGGPQKEAGAGAVCFRAEDCRPGLACVPESAAADKRVCSADLSLIVAMVDGAPAEAAPANKPDSSTGGSGPAEPDGDAEPAGAPASPTAGAASGGAPAGGGAAAAGGAE